MTEVLEELSKNNFTSFPVAVLSSISYEIQIARTHNGVITVMTNRVFLLGIQDVFETYFKI